MLSTLHVVLVGWTNDNEFSGHTLFLSSALYYRAYHRAVQNALPQSGMSLVAPKRSSMSVSDRGSARRKVFRLENLEARQLLAANVIITEFMAKNDDFLQDGRHRSRDWIEVFNAGDEDVDLHGYQLSDDPDDPSRWTFFSRVLPPEQHLVVFASGNDFVDEAGYLHTNVRFSASGEYLGLISPNGQVVSQFGTSNSDFPAHRSNVTFSFPCR